MLRSVWLEKKHVAFEGTNPELPAHEGHHYGWCHDEDPHWVWSGQAKVLTSCVYLKQMSKTSKTDTLYSIVYFTVPWNWCSAYVGCYNTPIGQSILYYKLSLPCVANKNMKKNIYHSSDWYMIRCCDFLVLAKVIHGCFAWRLTAEAAAVCSSHTSFVGVLKPRVD